MEKTDLLSVNVRGLNVDKYEKKKLYPWLPESKFYVQHSQLY